MHSPRHADQSRDPKEGRRHYRTERSGQRKPCSRIAIRTHVQRDRNRSHELLAPKRLYEGVRRSAPERRFQGCKSVVRTFLLRRGVPAPGRLVWPFWRKSVLAKPVPVAKETREVTCAIVGRGRRERVGIPGRPQAEFARHEEDGLVITRRRPDFPHRHQTAELRSPIAGSVACEDRFRPTRSTHSTL